MNMKILQAKQVEALEVLTPEGNKEDIKSVQWLFPKEMMKTNEMKNEKDEIKNWEEKTRRKD